MAADRTTLSETRAEETSSDGHTGVDADHRSLHPVDALRAAGAKVVERLLGPTPITDESLGSHVRNRMIAANFHVPNSLASGIQYPSNFAPNFHRVKALASIDVDAPDPVVVQAYAPELALLPRLLQREGLRNRRAHAQRNLAAAPFQELLPEYMGGYADPHYFERVDNAWRLRAGKSASAALKAWFRGLTITFCDFIVVASQIDAVRDAIGDQAFDERYGMEGAPPTPDRLVIAAFIEETPFGSLVSKQPAGDSVGTIGKRPVRLGDHAIFWNHPCYMLKHPTGLFRLENATYVGAPFGQQLWSGLGIPLATEDRIYDIMVEDYNRPSTAAEKAFPAFRPAWTGPTDGTATPEQIAQWNKPVSFPDKITKEQFLNDRPIPAVEQSGMFNAEHGGYQPSTRKHLDASKVAQLRR